MVINNLQIKQSDKSEPVQINEKVKDTKPKQTEEK
jgi:hypothetical protein